MIKLFEEYNQYYNKIEYSEYTEKSEDGNWVPFTKNQLSRLSDFNKKGFSIGTSLNDTLIWIISENYDYMIKIFQDNNEWFYIEFRNDKLSWYKCDQFDGCYKLFIDTL